MRVPLTQGVPESTASSAVIVSRARTKRDSPFCTSSFIDRTSTDTSRTRGRFRLGMTEQVAHQPPAPVDGEDRRRFVGELQAHKAVAYAFYREKYRGVRLAKLFPRIRDRALMKDRSRCETAVRPRIECIGVWDTVDACGFPVDERHTFHPVLWDEREESNPERIEQVWFPGVHSDGGGGCPRGWRAMRYSTVTRGGVSPVRRAGS